MALTYVYAVKPAGAAVSAVAFPPQSGAGVSVHSYTPNASGIVTGVIPGDALTLNVQGGTGLVKLCGTGATADRPTPAASAVSAGANFPEPGPVFGDVFFDTTLGVPIWYVGSNASTGWVNSAGAAV